MKHQLVLGVDIGGSKVAAGVVTGAGKIVGAGRAPMNTSGGAELGMNAVHQAIAQVYPAQYPAVAAIGIASPGPLDLHEGLVLKSPNLPCWQNFPLRAAIESTYGLPTRLENDANAAGLAEVLWGAANGCDSVVYVTIGTGIGTGVVIQRRIYQGQGAAAEGGHMSIRPDDPVRCGCGKPGCIEGLAAGPAIARRAQEKTLRDPGRKTAWAGPITAQSVVAAWQQGDALATETIEETLDLLAIWLGNIIDLLDPEVIVVGGGVGVGLIPAFPSLSSKAARWSIHSGAGKIPIRPAKYGIEAGIAGSAALWFQEEMVPAHIG
jgi:glucokinase